MRAVAVIVLTAVFLARTAEIKTVLQQPACQQFVVGIYTAVEHGDDNFGQLHFCQPQFNCLKSDLFGNPRLCGIPYRIQQFLGTDFRLGLAVCRFVLHDADIVRLYIVHRGAVRIIGIRVFGGGFGIVL